MVLNEFSLEGKKAIVTGAGQGLGKAMALALANAGADVAIAELNPDTSEQTANEVSNLGKRSISIPTNVTDSQQVERMVARVLDEFGVIDILVNNAGGRTEGYHNPPLELTDEQWFLGINTNLSGAFFCSRAAGRHMVARGQGKIINIASGFGMRAGPSMVYCVAKGGVIQLTRALGYAWARSGVRVNAIAPGVMRARESYGEEADMAREARARFIPVGREGMPYEMGPLAIFLASDASNYVTGEVFLIDGGTLAAGYAPVQYMPKIEIQ